MTLKVILQEGEDGWIVARVPALVGCWSQGKTRKEALANIREAAEVWLEVQQDKVERTLAPTNVELIKI